MTIILGRGNARKTYEMPHPSVLKGWSNVDYNTLRDTLCKIVGCSPVMT